MRPAPRRYDAEGRLLPPSESGQPQVDPNALIPATRRGVPAHLVTKLTKEQAEMLARQGHGATAGGLLTGSDVEGQGVVLPDLDAFQRMAAAQGMQPAPAASFSSSSSSSAIGATAGAGMLASSAPVVSATPGVDPRSMGKSAYILASASSDLRCPLSHALLEDPVLMPCCGEAVQRAAALQQLPARGFVCPLCSTPDVSPDQLAPFAGMKRRVQKHVAEAGQRWEQAARTGTDSVGGVSALHAAPISSGAIGSSGGPAASSLLAASSSSAHAVGTVGGLMANLQ